MATHSTIPSSYYFHHLPPSEQTIIEIPFTPTNPLIGFNWNCPLQFLHYLIHHPSERRNLYQMARKHPNSRSATFSVTHPLLKTGLQLFPWRLDSVFFAHLRSLSLQLELWCQAENHTTCPITFRTIQGQMEYYYYVRTSPANRDESHCKHKEEECVVQ